MVLGCNIIKALCLATVLVVFVDGPLVTGEGAIKSFLDRPDMPTTDCRPLSISVTRKLLKCPKHFKNVYSKRICMPTRGRVKNDDGYTLSHGLVVEFMGYKYLRTSHHLMLTGYIIDFS